MLCYFNRILFISYRMCPHFEVESYWFILNKYYFIYRIYNLSSIAAAKKNSSMNGLSESRHFPNTFQQSVRQTTTNCVSLFSHFCLWLLASIAGTRLISGPAKTEEQQQQQQQQNKTRQHYNVIICTFHYKTERSCCCC